MATRTDAPGHAPPPAELGKGRFGEAPSTPSDAGGRPHPRSIAAPTRCAVWPHRS